MGLQPIAIFVLKSDIKLQLTN